MTRINELVDLLYFKGTVKNNQIKIFELNDKNNKGDFVIIISMKGSK
jgi:hypothetical protein